MKARDRLIVALDVDTMEKAESLVKDLSPIVGCFKVGLQLLTAVGAPEVVTRIHAFGGSIFFDGKFDDIPNTVAGAAKAIAAMNVKMFDVHASAGRKSVEAAVENKGRSLVLGVTVLTSISENECLSIFGDYPGEKVLYFARMLVSAKADGVVCSPQELSLLGKADGLEPLMKVIPGIRPDWAAAGDQKRVMTPREAIKAGATMLVVGRPILEPPAVIGSPVDAVESILGEIEQAS